MPIGAGGGVAFCLAIDAIALPPFPIFTSCRPSCARLEMQEGAAKKQQSENEDIDYEKVITEMLTQEAIHNAALSVGARIIQPSLVDFLR